MTEFRHSAGNGGQRAEQSYPAPFGHDKMHTRCRSDRMAIALLSAVSHDLRGSVAAAKAAVESLRSNDLRFGHEQRRELADAGDQSLNRLGRAIA